MLEFGLSRHRCKIFDQERLMCLGEACAKTRSWHRDNFVEMQCIIAKVVTLRRFHSHVHPHIGLTSSTNAEHGGATDTFSASTNGALKKSL